LFLRKVHDCFASVWYIRAVVQRVGILGLGYVGLPLGVAFAEAGLRVVGVDTDPKKVVAVNRGISYIEDVPSERLEPLASNGKLEATEDTGAFGEVDAILVCLPTPLNKNREPDLSVVLAGAEAAAEHLRPGTLIVLESTTYPGTTRELLQPVFEREGRRVGKDFFLAFSPERIDPGNPKYGVRDIPVIVGGITPECTQRARELYEQITYEVHAVSTPESAEFSKLLENIFRGVNIALVNELAILCNRMGVDVWEVIEAASTKPFGFMPFFPGPGLGGHCIPIDPFYLSWRARAYDLTTEFIELAGRVNVHMPYYAMSRIVQTLNDAEKASKGSRVLLLGMSYKPNVGDLRESPSLKLLGLLRGAGAEVSYHDPHIPTLPEWGLSSVELTEEELRKTDCVVVATDHSLMDLQLVVDAAPQVVDLRNAVRYRLWGRPNGPLPPNVEVL
jgi:UDP-N-acetyl-D-glucosamine dehydrogenase